jgi:hypothetical protein
MWNQYTLRAKPFHTKLQAVFVIPAKAVIQVTCSFPGFMPFHSPGQPVRRDDVRRNCHCGRFAMTRLMILPILCVVLFSLTAPSRASKLELYDKYQKEKQEEKRKKQLEEKEEDKRRHQREILRKKQEHDRDMLRQKKSGNKGWNRVAGPLTSNRIRTLPQRPILILRLV